MMTAPQNGAAVVCVCVCVRACVCCGGACTLGVFVLCTLVSPSSTSTQIATTCSAAQPNSIAHCDAPATTAPAVVVVVVLQRPSTQGGGAVQ